MNQFLRDIIGRVAERFDPASLGDRLGGLVENGLVAVAVMLAFVLGWKLLQWALVPGVKRMDLDATTRSFVESVIKYTVLTLGFVAALGELGVNTASILTSLGVAGLTIGFAARDAMSNIISGFFIFWDRPFVIGDLVEVAGEYGRVERITMRSTRVVTVEGKMLAIPNSTVVNTVVASYTNFPHLRIDVPISIGLEEDIDRVRSLLLGVVTGNPDFQTEPAPVVAVTALGDFNLTVELRVWLDNERDHVPVRLALREKMYGTLLEAGVSMPYETLSLTPIELQGAA